MKKALISGVTGQDGSYLAEFLIDKGYEVHGMRRRTSYPNTANIEHLCLDPHLNNAKLILHYGDMNYFTTKSPQSQKELIIINASAT